MIRQQGALFGSCFGLRAVHAVRGCLAPWCARRGEALRCTAERRTSEARCSDQY